MSRTAFWRELVFVVSWWEWDVSVELISVPYGTQRGMKGEVRDGCSLRCSVFTEQAAMNHVLLGVLNERGVLASYSTGSRMVFPHTITGKYLNELETTVGLNIMPSD